MTDKNTHKNRRMRGKLLNEVKDPACVNVQDGF